MLVECLAFILCGGLSKSSSQPSPLQPGASIPTHIDVRTKKRKRKSNLLPRVVVVKERRGLTDPTDRVCNER